MQGGDGLSVNTSAYHRVNGTELSPQDLDAEEPPWVLNSLNEAKGPDSAENFVSLHSGFVKEGCANFCPQTPPYEGYDIRASPSPS